MGGRLAFNGLFVGVEEVGFDFVELGLVETVFESAAEFLFENRNRVFPAVFGGGDVDGAVFHRLEPDASGCAAALDGRVLFFRENGKATVEHGVGHREGLPFKADGHGIRFDLGFVELKEGKVVGGYFGV